MDQKELFTLEYSWIKRSPMLVLDTISLQRILLLEQFVSASKLAPKVLSANKVNS